MGKIIADRYELLTEVGRGGMSTVYLARDLSLTKNWAVKEVYKKGILKGQMISNGLLAEANLMKNLDHPALPRIVEIIEEEDRYYIVMDYIEGETLKRVLDESGPQSQERVIKWAKELAAILHYLHSQNPPIIYRDMKPANIILQPDGRLKLIDFGIAKVYDAEKREDTLALGTDAFAAPEQYYNSKGILVKADVRTDIYNLGATMYNLLTDMLPTDEPYRFLPIRQINPEYSAGLEKIIIKCIEPDPKDRFQTVADLVGALMNYEKLDEEYIYEQKKKLRKAFYPAAAGIIAIILGVGGLVAGTLHDRSTYEGLTEGSGNTAQRVEDLQKAISMEPQRTEGYEILAKTLAQDGDGLTEAESEQILFVYNKNRQDLEKDKEAFLDVNYMLGEDYLIYYTGTSDDSIRNRILTAYPFFEAVVQTGEEDYENYAMAQAYTNLGDFYKNYIVGQTDTFVKEAGQKEHAKLLKDMKDAVSLAERTGNNQLQLITCRTCLNIISAERTNLALTTKQDAVLSVINAVSKSSQSIDTANAALAQQKSELENEIRETKKAVKTSYENAIKKESGDSQKSGKEKDQ